VVTKFWPVPTWTGSCPTCERELGVAPWVYGVHATGLIAVLIASFVRPEGPVKWIVFGSAILISLVVAALTPLVRRTKQKEN
jgi:hypothetical protein